MESWLARPLNLISPTDSSQHCMKPGLQPATKIRGDLRASHYNMFGGKIQAQAHSRVCTGYQFMQDSWAVITGVQWLPLTTQERSKPVYQRAPVPLAAGAWSCAFPCANTNACLAVCPAWLVCTHHPSFPRAVRGHQHQPSHCLHPWDERAHEDITHSQSSNKEPAQPWGPDWALNFFL